MAAIMFLIIISIFKLYIDYMLEDKSVIKALKVSSILRISCSRPIYVQEFAHVLQQVFYCMHWCNKHTQ